MRFFNKPKLTLVANDVPAIVNAATLDHILRNRWDWSAEENVQQFFENAWLGEHEPYPGHFIELFTEVKPRIERAFTAEKRDVTEVCTQIAMDLLGMRNNSHTKEALPSRLFSERAVGIAVVFGITAGKRELMIGFMRYSGIDPLFGFAAARILAKLRNPETGVAMLSREELDDWRKYLLSGMNNYNYETLAKTLEIIERDLRTHS